MRNLNSIQRHIKTGKLYEVIDIVINATNAQHDASMVLYCNIHNTNNVFVRELVEFQEKFVEVTFTEVCDMVTLGQKAIHRSNVSPDRGDAMPYGLLESSTYVKGAPAPGEKQKEEFKKSVPCEIDAAAHCIGIPGIDCADCNVTSKFKLCL